MAPVGSTRGPNASYYSGLIQAMVLPLGETSLSQVATRLHIDPDDLLTANPHTTNSDE